MAQTIKVRRPEHESWTPLDGYAWMEHITRGSINYRFVVLPEYGDWPYSIIASGGTYQHQFVVLEYTEHDVKSWYFDSLKDRETFITNTFERTN